MALEIEGRARRLIVGTGSNVSILQPGVSRNEIRDSTLKPFGRTGEVLSIKGQQRVSFELGRQFVHPFLVCPIPTGAAGLLGMDYLEKSGR